GAKEGETCGEFFPVSGRLTQDQGELVGTHLGFFWSSTNIVGSDTYYCVGFDEGGPTAPNYFVTSLFGMPVRCVPQ
ncbi:MAG: hypothetical protein ACRCY5_07995, partial [Phocaeicola sp.]